MQVTRETCGEGNGTPLQYSCLENPRDRGACWAAVCGEVRPCPPLPPASNTSYLPDFSVFNLHLGFPGGSMVKNPPANAVDLGSIPGSGRSPGEGNGNPLQYSCLENPMDRGSWWATVHAVAKSWT